MSAFGVVILAAGASRRMGRPKALLPWGDSTVIGHIIEQWRVLGAMRFGVVRAPKNEDLVVELNRLGIREGDHILNPEPERGMFSSVQCASAWRGWEKSIDRVVLTLVDQPHLRRGTLAALMRAVAEEPLRIWQPEFAGRGRHPLVFPRSIFSEIAGASGETLKDVLKEHRGAVSRVPLDDPGLAHDLDTPEDYQRALSAFPPEAPRT